MINQQLYLKQMIKYYIMMNTGSIIIVSNLERTRLPRRYQTSYNKNILLVLKSLSLHITLKRICKLHEVKRVNGYFGYWLFKIKFFQKLSYKVVFVNIRNTRTSTYLMIKDAKYVFPLFKKNIQPYLSQLAPLAASTHFAALCCSFLIGSRSPPINAHRSPNPQFHFDRSDRPYYRRPL